MGLIHRVLFDVVEAAGGKDALVEVRRRVGLREGDVFPINENHDDAQWRRLLGASCEVLDLSRAQLLEAYAEGFFADARLRWPAWFEMSSNAREFLRRQPAIHNGFYTSIGDSALRAALREKFRIEERERELVTHYRSPNQLCALYQALAARVLRHYRERATIEQPRCAERGDPECEIHIRWDADA